MQAQRDIIICTDHLWVMLRMEPGDLLESKGVSDEHRTLYSDQAEIHGRTRSASVKDFERMASSDFNN